jgi:hypothetical protein
MKDEAEVWRSRSPVQRQAELEAEALGVPYEDVLRRLEEESRQSGEESEYRIREGGSILGISAPAGPILKGVRAGPLRGTSCLPGGAFADVAFLYGRLLRTSPFRSSTSFARTEF